ncbi:MAG: hypothetical protein WDZ41_00805 [Candidatus Babeliales bacterium]
MKLQNTLQTIKNYLKNLGKSPMLPSVLIRSGVPMRSDVKYIKEKKKGIIGKFWDRIWSFFS